MRFGYRAASFVQLAATFACRAPRFAALATDFGELAAHFVRLTTRFVLLATILFWYSFLLAWYFRKIFGPLLRQPAAAVLLGWLVEGGGESVVLVSPGCSSAPRVLAKVAPSRATRRVTS